MNGPRIRRFVAYQKNPGKDWNMVCSVVLTKDSEGRLVKGISPCDEGVRKIVSLMLEHVEDVPTQRLANIELRKIAVAGENG